MNPVFKKAIIFSHIKVYQLQSTVNKDVIDPNNLMLSNNTKFGLENWHKLQYI